MKIKTEKSYYGELYILVNEDKPLKALCSLNVEEESDFNKEKYIPEYIDKKVLYITNFSTSYFHRNKGYAKLLLTDVISRLKSKYDIIHLNACPYYIKNFDVVYETPDNGLDMNKLVEFYKSFGFEMCGTTEEGWKIMLLKQKTFNKD